MFIIIIKPKIQLLINLIYSFIDYLSTSIIPSINKITQIVVCWNETLSNKKCFIYYAKRNRTRIESYLNDVRRAKQSSEENTALVVLCTNFTHNTIQGISLFDVRCRSSSFFGYKLLKI